MVCGFWGWAWFDSDGLTARRGRSRRPPLPMAPAKRVFTLTGGCIPACGCFGSFLRSRSDSLPPFMVRGEILDRERGLPHPGEVSPVPPRGGINPRRFLFVLRSLYCADSFFADHLRWLQQTANDCLFCGCFALYLSVPIRTPSGNLANFLFFTLQFGASALY